MDYDKIKGWMSKTHTEAAWIVPVSGVQNGIRSALPSVPVISELGLNVLRPENDG
jgi:hypothetical protein